MHRQKQYVNYKASYDASKFIIYYTIASNKPSLVGNNDFNRRSLLTRVAHVTFSGRGIISTARK